MADPSSIEAQRQSHEIRIPVGVVLAREEIDHPWQDYRWRPIDVRVGPSPMAPGTIVHEEPGALHYFAAVVNIELHRKDTEAYLINLNNEPPVSYVILRDTEDEPTASGLPYEVHTVTLSPYEAQDYLDSGEEIVEPIPMSETLMEWLGQFVAMHHEEQVFKKRRRDRVDIREEKFGQEPIEAVRKRQRRRYDA